MEWKLFFNAKPTMTVISGPKAGMWGKSIKCVTKQAISANMVAKFEYCFTKEIKQYKKYIFCKTFNDNDRTTKRS